MKKKFIFAFSIFLALKILPTLADDFQNGINAYNKGDFTAAERYFRTAAAYNPNNQNINYYLAISLVRNKKYKEAQEIYLTIVSKAPNREAAQRSSQGLDLLYKYYSPSKVELDIAGHNSAIIVRQVKVNNAVRTDLILDSGATFTSISTELARKLGLSYYNTPVVQVVTANGTVNAHKVMLDSVEVNGLVARNVEVIVLDIGSAKGVSGLLGLSFIQKFKVTIDHKAGKLILEKT